MRNSLLRFLVLAGLILVLVLPVTAGERVYHAWKHTDNESEQIIYDLSVPWPFRNAEWAGAASIRPEQMRKQMEAQLLKTGVLRLANIHFGTAKTQPTVESSKVLDQVGRILMDRPRLKIEISGHADSRGPDDFNQRLSEKRARTVRKYLATRFPKIRNRLLATVGYGETRPIASNADTKGRATNRRVEFRVLNEDEINRLVHIRSYRSSRK
jgi:outer membrane protein OmpA-like peptidoglycan-associated protein